NIGPNKRCPIFLHLFASAISFVIFEVSMEHRPIRELVPTVAVRLPLRVVSGIFAPIFHGEAAYAMRSPGFELSCVAAIWVGHRPHAFLAARCPFTSVDDSFC